jgi:hypothetical protein
MVILTVLPTIALPDAKMGCPPLGHWHLTRAPLLELVVVLLVLLMVLPTIAPLEAEMGCPPPGV